MKIVNAVLFLFSILFIIACDQITETDSNLASQQNGYVNSDSILVDLLNVNTGDSFVYSVDTLNLVTGQYETIGTREVFVKEKIDDGEFGFYSCTEKYNINDSLINTYSKFRFSGNSLDFFVELNGVRNLIPDSVSNQITLDLPEVYQLIESSFKEKSWDVYRGGATYGAFRFNILSVKGEYVGTEDLQVERFEETITTEKFKYYIDLDIPNIQNPFAARIKEYEAYIWIAPEIGIVKIEGCSLFIKPVTGFAFNDADSNKVTRHTLVSVVK